MIVLWRHQKYQQNMFLKGKKKTCFEREKLKELLSKRLIKGTICLKKESEGRQEKSWLLILQYQLRHQGGYSLLLYLLKFHSIAYLCFMITVVYFYTQFEFRFHLLPFNITTARECTAAFHYYLGIIYGISLCVFLSGVRDFTVVMQGLLTYLCTLLGHNISNYLLIIASHYLRFTHIIWDFLGRISGSNTVRTFVSYYVSLYFYFYTWLSRSCINMVATVHLAQIE